MAPQLRILAATLVAAALLPACAPQPPEREKPAERQAPADFPQSFYDQAAARGEPVYRVDPKQSVAVIEVRRGGSLARLGHDHVIAAHNMAGFVAPQTGRADLYVALDGLVVDEPELRKAAGFDTQPSESDIAGTRTNMLEKVLEAEKFPHALIGIRVSRGQLAVAITLHGTTRTMEVPAQLTVGDPEIHVTGKLAFNQTDFGITPFSILGGAVAVQDRLELRFDVRAERFR
jgi:YceI-like protein